LRCAGRDAGAQRTKLENENFSDDFSTWDGIVVDALRASDAGCAALSVYWGKTSGLKRAAWWHV
jgi:hypothetical protein